MKKGKLSKILGVAAFAAFSAVAAYADHDEFTTDASRLPAPALETIKKAYPDAKVVGIEIDKGFSTEYEVRLSDGTKLDFNSGGDWESVENKAAGAADMFVPDFAKKYVAEKFSAQKITKVSKKAYGFEVDISNGLEIKFDKEGKVIGIDD